MIQHLHLYYIDLHGVKSLHVVLDGCEILLLEGCVFHRGEQLY